MDEDERRRRLGEVYAILLREGRRVSETQEAYEAGAPTDPDEITLAVRGGQVVLLIRGITYKPTDRQPYEGGGLARDLVRRWCERFTAATP